MAAVSHYQDDPVRKLYLGSLAELLALSKSALNSGDRFFTSDTVQEYIYCATKDWILWKKHTTT